MAIIWCESNTPYNIHCKFYTVTSSMKIFFFIRWIEMTKKKMWKMKDCAYINGRIEKKRIGHARCDLWPSFNIQHPTFVTNFFFFLLQINMMSSFARKLLDKRKSINRVSLCVFGATHKILDWIVYLFNFSLPMLSQHQIDINKKYII